MRDVPKLPRRALDCLSPREVEVYGLLREKLSTREIASKMKVSPHTVLSHVKMIRTKFRVRGYLS